MTFIAKQSGVAIKAMPTAPGSHRCPVCVKVCSCISNSKGCRPSYKKSATVQSPLESRFSPVYSWGAQRLLHRCCHVTVLTPQAHTQTLLPKAHHVCSCVARSVSAKNNRCFIMRVNIKTMLQMVWCILHMAESSKAVAPRT